MYDLIIILKAIKFLNNIIRYDTAIMEANEDIAKYISSLIFPQFCDQLA